MLKTLSGDHHRRLGVLWHIAAILHHCHLLELLNRSGLSIFFTVVEWIVLLGDLETQSREEQPSTNCNESTSEHQHTRSLLLEMHGWVRIRQLII